MVHLLGLAVIASFPVLTAFGAATDFLTMTLPNRLTLGLFALGVVALAITAPGWAAVGWHVAAAALVFACGFAVFAMGWMGGGDVKFAAAIALWLGWDNLLEFALGFSIWGGVLTVATLAADRLLEPVPALKIGFLAQFSEHRHVPYGVALAVSALLVFPSTPWFARLIG